jgi:predicted metal-dependent hydrolase
MAEPSELKPGQKRERPRDELGRPLKWGAENRLVMEDFDALSREENHRLAAQHFNAGRFFQAHEAWETCWKQSKGTEDEEFFKGLSQLGAGYTHYLRDNPHGARTLMERGLRRILPHAPKHHGIDVEALAAVVRSHADAIGAAERAGKGMPEIAPPIIP